MVVANQQTFHSDPGASLLSMTILSRLLKRENDNQPLNFGVQYPWISSYLYTVDKLIYIYIYNQPESTYIYIYIFTYIRITTWKKIRNNTNRLTLCNQYHLVWWFQPPWDSSRSTRSSLVTRLLSPFGSHRLTGYSQ